MTNSILIDAKDNVAVATEEIAQHDNICFFEPGGMRKQLTAVDAITIYHKFATETIAIGCPIIKYGEHIGIAATEIKPGMHVHAHNVKSVRENL